MQKLKILIVLYNKYPEDSETIQSLSAIKDQLNNNIEIYIWDNSSKELDSTHRQILEELIYPIKYKYRADGVNTPLSIIYNTLIREEILNTDVLVIFDHDSSFDIGYFQSLNQALEKETDINLFLPIIKYNNTIVSPANLWYFKGEYWKTKKIGKVKSKHKTAINSGMAIRGNYLKNKFVGYNENVLFYGTDDDFMRKYSKQNEYFYVLNNEINHILNFFENDNTEDKVKRYKQMRKSSLIMMKQENIFIYILAKVYFFINSCKLAISNKTIRFIN